MRCPFCPAVDTRVMDSRDSAEGTIIRRRRECETCKRRFTTNKGLDIKVVTLGFIYTLECHC